MELWACYILRGWSVQEAKLLLLKFCYFHGKRGKLVLSAKKLFWAFKLSFLLLCYVASVHLTIKIVLHTEIKNGSERHRDTNQWMKGMKTDAANDELRWRGEEWF